MCLALVALDAHPRLPVVIAANRDEFHAREAAPAHWWPDGMLAGVDRVGGGTWLGVDGKGRWALVTNFREGVARDPAAPSRGTLVMRALADRAPPLACAAAIAVDGSRYHGFNLLVGDLAQTAYGSNRSSGALALTAGIHGLSNHLLDTSWPKVARSKASLAAYLQTGNEHLEPLFDLLADRARAEPATLPSTGLSPEWESLLSSAFIVDPIYGTRCSTILTIARDGAARFAERSFGAEGRLTAEVAFEFSVSR